MSEKLPILDQRHGCGVFVLVQDDVGATTVELDDPVVLLLGFKELGGATPALFADGEEGVVLEAQGREQFQNHVGAEPVIQGTREHDQTGLGFHEVRRPLPVGAHRVKVSHRQHARAVVAEQVEVVRLLLRDRHVHHLVRDGEVVFVHLAHALEGAGVELLGHLVVGVVMRHG
jgi:hypothetical protein